jgi:hypothetical protein
MYGTPHPKYVPAFKGTGDHEEIPQRRVSKLQCLFGYAETTRPDELLAQMKN